VSRDIASLAGAIALALAALLALGAPAQAAPLRLERVVLIQRHGVRPPTSSNAELARYAAQPWPAWPVAPGELTPHGARTVALVGRTLRAAYVRAGLLPRIGCPAPGAVTVWADGTEQRTRLSGQTLARALAPGCAAKAFWTADAADPVFFGHGGACHVDADWARQAVLADAGPGGLETPATRRALAALQSVLAPDACEGGKGYCFSGADSLAGKRPTGPLFLAASLSEDLLLEYAEGMPLADIGWGRAPPAVIGRAMATHERVVQISWRARYVAARLGGPMARLMLGFLHGRPIDLPDGLQTTPSTRVLALAGHDANIAFMGAVFGLDWRLPGEPDSTAPATALAFELWRDGATSARYVRPVIYYESLDQLRSLSPPLARRLPLRFSGCAEGPLGACPLAKLERRVEAVVPAGCGALEHPPLDDPLAASTTKP